MSSLPNIAVDDLCESRVTAICRNVECLGFNRGRVQGKPFQMFLVENCIWCFLLRY